MHPWIAGGNDIRLSGSGIAGIGDVGVPVKAADYELVAEWAGDVGETGDVEWLDAIDAERIEIFSIIGVGEAATETGPKPVVLFAEGDFVIEEMSGDVGFDETAMVCGTEGT
jgi:hypothetical protein